MMMIYFTADYFCLVCKMSDNREKCQFKSNMTASNASFCPQTDDIQLMVIAEELSGDTNPKCQYLTT